MKKRRTAGALLLALAMAVSGCGKATPETPLTVIDDKYRTTYEIFVYSFSDSDGDGIGDLKGVNDKLNYINDGDDSTDEDLGCNQIWLMPISPSPTYHKYDVTDYKAIDPQYGTMEDFEELIKACHERGINVLLDMVFNHTSSEHPWFLEAKKYLLTNRDISFDGDMTEHIQNCPYLEYYNFSNEKKDGYELLSGSKYYYEARFWSGMPDLNLDSEAVRNEINSITDFWLDKGVDGFRLDAVTYYYTGNDAQNIEFLSWLNEAVKSHSSDAYIVSEAWVNSATYHKYYSSGIDSFFDFDFAGSEGVIAGVARGTTAASNYAVKIAEAEKEIANENPLGIDAPFYTNHDMARSAGYYTGAGAREKIKLAGALNLLMAGNAFIYYGEELGMKGSGKDENKRAPMYWSSDKGAQGMCSGPQGMDSFEMSYPSLEEQIRDEYSIYNYYKHAIKLRNQYPVIARGTTVPVEEISGKNIGAFLRQGDPAALEGTDDSILIVFNTSKEAQTVDLGAAAQLQDYTRIAEELKNTDASSKLKGSKLTIAPYAVVVIRRN